MLYINISFFGIFLIMMVVSSIILKDLNLEKYFKQGRIGSIRAFYLILVVIISFLVAFTFREMAIVIMSFSK